MAWDIEASDDFVWWYRHLPEAESDRVDAKMALLEARGPALGRPHVAEINIEREAYRGRITNLKELRVGTMRILFAFDRRRTAYLLLAGDKRGDWKAWYDRAIPKAITNWDEHLAWLEEHS